jgi:hypothetical protein
VTYVPAPLRRLVEERAQNRCEYCRLHIEDAFWPHEVDHIYAEKHGGATVEINLCFSCNTCNRYKGSDICSLDPATGDVTTLFHPRHDQWSAHFRLENGRIEPQTATGRVTVRLLHFNDDDRIQERRRLIQLGCYA